MCAIPFTKTEEASTQVCILLVYFIGGIILVRSSLIYVKQIFKSMRSRRKTETIQKKNFWNMDSTIIKEMCKFI